jgi:hypothetical protein
MTIQLIKKRFSFIGQLLAGIISVVISSTFFLASKVVIGFIEFVSSFFPRSKRSINFERHSVAICLIASWGLILVNTKGAKSILASALNIQVVIFLANIILLATIFKYGKITLDVPGSTNEITEGLGELPFYKWFAMRLRNPSDIVWVKTIFILTILVVPAFIGILSRNLFGVYTLLLYGVIWWAGSSALSMLEHANSHRHVFRAKKKMSKLDRIILIALTFYTEFLLVFMFARVPKWYEVQHVYVHHQEDNGEKDTQSTLKYDRSSFIDFALCANRFALSGFFSFDVITYLVKKNRTGPLADLLLGMSAFYIILGAISFWNWHFAVTILAFRYCSQIMATLGFFHEHGMVDAIDPQNIYRNSLHFVSTTNSHASLGDDAHIEHHLHMGRHWTHYMTDVNNNLNRYSDEGALGYIDCANGVCEYYKLIWRKDYATLAQHFIVFGNETTSKEQIATLLWERTRPANSRQRQSAFEHLDNVLGRVMGFLLV